MRTQRQSVDSGRGVTVKGIEFSGVGAQGDTAPLSPPT